MSSLPPLTIADDDPRWLAFRSPDGPEVFHSVVSTHDIWKADPFDVEGIHAEARDVFARTVDRIGHPAGERARPGTEDNAGKILLLRGESGAGKTHLLRAFRHALHSRGLGWFAYLQMTTSIGHYPLYILRNLVESLSQPYDLSSGAAESGWLRLSNFLVEHPSVPADLRHELREGESENGARLVPEITEYLINDPHIVRGQVQADVLSAVLFFQRREPSFSSRAVKFLRCEPLTPRDRDYLCGLEGRTAAEDPLEMLVQIGRLTHLFERQALVLCLDQLEEIWTYNDDARQRFRDAMGALRALTDKHPGALVVVACLDDYYEKLKALIAADQSLLDRIEKEAPVPVLLQTNRSQPEVEQLIAKRLDALYQSQDVELRPGEPLFPFAPEDVAKLANLRPRGVLYQCRVARERSVRTGEPPRIGEEPAPAAVQAPAGATPEGAAAPEMEARWNDFRNGLTAPPPEDGAALASLLAWAVEEVNAEVALPTGGERYAARANHTFVEIETPSIPDLPRRWQAGVCNAGASGGKLSRQVADLTAAARGAQPARVPVAVRSTEYPGKTPGSQIAKQFAAMIKEGGRRVVIEDAEWRTIQALREFLPRQTDPAATDAWRAAERPLARLPGLRELLRVDALPRAGRVTPLPAAAVVVEPAVVDRSPETQTTQEITSAPAIPADPETGPVSIGRTREAVPKPVAVDPMDLTRHTAFLGGSGSGKTTVALALIESLLLRGIPAILLDRKGDLACYARPESWTAPLPVGHGPDAEARRARLRERVDVRLFTPGAAGGRPLGISLLPRGAGALPGPEREAAARAAAASLGGMLGYRTNATAPRLAVLSKAIEILAELEPDAEMTLPRLADFVASEDNSLVNAIGHLEPKHFKKLLDDLASFQFLKGHLLAPGGERVKAERLFGLADGDDAAPAGKTRLSIISTRFFDDTASALFWTAQFLLEMGRFAAKRPSPGQLQGVVLFDEADLYLPATGKPVTKEPMENALRRWRSAGLGVMLATQSPGDFDYKCRENVRNWFVGQVKENTALSKMRPMLKEARTDIAAKLPGLEAGQFFLVRAGQVESLAATRSLVAPEQLPEAEILQLAGGGAG